jgi:hypothetical protein
MELNEQRIRGGAASVRSGDSSDETSSARPGQDLWRSEVRRRWTLIDEDPFVGEDAHLLVLVGYGGRWRQDPIARS